MAFAAGLGVIERPKTILQCLHFVECRSIGLVGRIVNHAVTLVVEPGRRVRVLLPESSKSKI